MEPEENVLWKKDKVMLDSKLNKIISQDRVFIEDFRWQQF